MIKSMFRILMLVLIACVPVKHLYAEKTFDLLPLVASDISPSVLVPADNLPLLNTTRQDVSISRVLAAQTRLDNKVKPHVASSRQYWKEVSAEQLLEGVKLQLLGAGALIKVTPILDANSAQISLIANDFSIEDASGLVYTHGAALSKSVTAMKMKELRIPANPGAVIMQLKTSLGTGEFTLKYRSPAAVAESFLVHVNDKNSDHVLNMQALSDNVFVNQEMAATLRLNHQGQQRNIDNVVLSLVSPAGVKIPVDAILKDSRLLISSGRSLPVTHAVYGLWELHAMVTSTVNGVKVQRNVKTGFAYSVPSAELTGKIRISAPSSRDRTLDIDFGLNAASAGRYEIRGILYGGNSNNERVPLMLANSAGWREAGPSTLRLEFELDKLQSGVGGSPYELRNLQLYDQGRMMLLHRQSTAFRTEKF
jgi:hypothetical protein